MTPGPGVAGYLAPPLVAFETATAASPPQSDL